MFGTNLGAELSFKGIHLWPHGSNVIALKGVLYKE
jgi:hypothetical protein